MVFPYFLQFKSIELLVQLLLLLSHLSCPTLCDPMDTRLLHPWDFLGKSTELGCHFLLQGIFLTQGLNPGLLHCRQMLYHDLNQIPYNYTVEVTNRFKGLYLIDQVPEELWTEVRDIVQ